jgi:hypothetical protein
LSRESVAGSGTYRDHEEQEQGREVQRPCFFCLEGWVFIGSLDHDGEEVVESHRCRRCNGSGVLARGGD